LVTLAAKKDGAAVMPAASKMGLGNTESLKNGATLVPAASKMMLW
jgi:hypothetical protein